MTEILHLDVLYYQYLASWESGNIAYQFLLSDYKLKHPTKFLLVTDQNAYFQEMSDFDALTNLYLCYSIVTNNQQASRDYDASNIENTTKLYNKDEIIKDDAHRNIKRIADYKDLGVKLSTPKNISISKNVTLIQTECGYYVHDFFLCNSYLECMNNNPGFLMPNLRFLYRCVTQKPR